MLNLPKLEETADTPEALFEKGNYAYAFHKSSNSELRACARIMCGAIAGGLNDLAACNVLSERSLLTKAYGYWCLSEKVMALEILAPIQSKIACKLAFFIENGAEVLICSLPGAERLENFENIKLSYQSVTHNNFGKCLISEASSWDLIVSFEAYGAYLPTNIFDVGCPTAFWVGDHDFFYATREPDFARATILVANSAAEHTELTRHYSARVVSFPGHETYGKSSEYYFSRDKKKYDVVYTGRAFVPYMRDKAQFLFRLATLDDPKLNIKIIEGYLPEDEFAEFMRSSKFVPTFWRYAGGIQTRAIDALRQGANILSPESLTAGKLLGGDTTGFVTVYSDFPENLALKHIGAYDNESIKCFNNSNFLDLFWPKPLRDHRFIKFCLFQSLLANQAQFGRRKNLPLPAELRGFIPEDAIKIYTAVATHNMNSKNKTVGHYNFSAAAAFFAATVGSGNVKLAGFSLEIYALGQEAFPNNMVLKFNAARALWTFDAKAEASVLFDKLAYLGNSLVFDPKDAVLSHRMHHLSEMFSYGDFLQIALKNTGLAKIMIQSCAFTYLGVYAFETGQSQKASILLKKAIVLSDVNVGAYRLLVEVLSHLSATPSELLKVFYKAIKLYPPNLVDLLPFGVAAELAEGNQIQAASLLNMWVLFHFRVRTPSGVALPLNQKSFDVVQENRSLLKDWVGEKFDQMKEVTAN
jgi:tetratricopeptide (TPR) repeat protein